jgi:hypothetical protein
LPRVEQWSIEATSAAGPGEEGEETWSAGVRGSLSDANGAGQVPLRHILISRHGRL